MKLVNFTLGGGTITVDSWSLEDQDDEPRRCRAYYTDDGDIVKEIVLVEWNCSVNPEVDYWRQCKLSPWDESRLCDLIEQKIEQEKREREALEMEEA